MASLRTHCCSLALTALLTAPSVTFASETPHGGVKQSGWGKDGSKYALEDYTVIKHITINTGV